MIMRVVGKIIIWLGKVRWEGLRQRIWGKRYNLSKEDWAYITELLLRINCVILTRRKAHLSTYMTNVAEIYVRGKIGYYSHVLMNLESETNGGTPALKLYESIGVGARPSAFEEVFDCDSVCILVPKQATTFGWENIVQEALDVIEKKIPYDGNFNINDDSKLSCVEFVRHCLKQAWDYSDRFNDFESIVQKTGQITPDMYYDCGDFDIVYEIRR